MKVSIFDYGTGNLLTLSTALEMAGADISVEAEPARALQADALVLPAVGEFTAASARLAPHAPALRAALASGFPCLGIGLGMHLLFEMSEENDGAGIAALRGRIRKLKVRHIPQIGWNDVAIGDDPLFENVDGFFGFYSNAAVAEPSDPATVIGWSEYEADRFPAAIRRDRTWGVQFQPEKSGDAGVRIIRNFVAAAQL